jgi:FeS assembly SUF system protein
MITVAPNEEVSKKVLEALKSCYDPEIPFNIVDLGLIYELNISDSGKVHIRMTVTSPGCPVGPWLMDEVTRACMSVEGVKDVEVELTFDPPWTPALMSEEAHKALGL